MTNRPSFTIVVKASPEAPDIERGYDADVLQIVRLPHDGDVPVRYGLAFRCSGSLELVPVERVKAVEFQAAGASWCPFCDNRLAG